MLHDSVGPRPSLLKRALAPALVFTFLPLASAFAQTHVRVTADGLEISSLRNWKEVRMTAPKGTVLEVFYVDGDRFQHRESNWYWVQLPGDAYGSKLAGWVRGDKVEHAPAPPSPPPSTASRVEVLPRAGANAEPGVTVTTVPSRPADEAAVARSTTARPARAVLSDVTLNFEFGKSDLTEEAKRKLAEAVVAPPASVQGVSVAVEGHADWVGGEAFNERLGLARAETVRRYLSEHFRIPADRIDVVSFGESHPVASNATRQGRASNRRVVIKGGA